MDYIRIEPLKEQKVFIFKSVWCKRFPDNPLMIEVEDKALGITDRGYVSAHFTPSMDNPDCAYFTILVDKTFKKHPNTFAYALDFTHGFSEDPDEDEYPLTQLRSANNIETIGTYMVEHWETYLKEPKL